jgi:dTDP-4-amino-4,6-dideoxygalactose transaminase
MIPYSRQVIEDDDIAAVEAVLRSDWITQGPAIARFEAAVCEYSGAKYGCAVNSATAGLHLACLALGLQRGMRLWTSPITFVASANCARYCGASVDFVDIDPRTYCMSIESLTEKLADAEARGRLPDIIVAVDFAAGIVLPNSRHVMVSGSSTMPPTVSVRSITANAWVAWVLPIAPCSVSIRSRYSRPARAA